MYDAGGIRLPYLSQTQGLGSPNLPTDILADPTKLKNRADVNCLYGFYYMLYIPFTPIFQLMTLKKQTFLTVSAILQVQSNNEMR